MKTLLTLISLSLTTIVIAQQNHLDVEGHTKIRGNINVASTIDTNSMFIGRNSGLNLTIGKNNTFTGVETGNDNTEGEENSFFGFAAGQKNATGSQNTFIGNDAGANNLFGEGNTFLGEASGFNNLGSWNVFMGSKSGFSTTSGQANTAVGFRALYSNTADIDGSGNQNVAIGAWALENAHSRGNTAVGTESLRQLTSGEENTALGEHGLENLGDGSNNTAIGYAALIEIDSSANDNVAVGSKAGFESKGSFNVYLGTNTGTDTYQGNYNTLLGNDSQTSDTVAQNQIVVGASARGKGDNTALIGDEQITDVYMAEDSGAKVHASNLKLNGLPSDNSSDSIVVLRPDSTLAVRDASSFFKPIAMAFIDIDGNVVSSTGNVSASFSGNTGNSSTSNIYSISIGGETVSSTTHIILLAPIMPDTTNPGHTRTTGIVYEGGDIKVRFSSTGSQASSAFNIVVYKY